MPNEDIARMLTDSGGKALQSPIVRERLGLRVGGLIPEEDAPTSAVPQRSRQQPSVQDRLFQRMLTADEYGYVRPGQGVLTAGAFRPEVRQLFEERGGLIGMDMTELSSEEQGALRMLLDPEYVRRQQPTDFNDFVRQHTGAAATPEELRALEREYIQSATGAATTPEELRQIRSRM